MDRLGGTRAGLVALGLLSLGGYALDLHRHFGRDLSVLRAYVAFFIALHAVYLISIWLVLRRGTADRVLLGLVLGFGVLFRVVVLPAPVVLSSDVYRYLWDGRVQGAGINPYRYAPDAPELAPLRDEVIHPSINRPGKRTVYPPGAQLTFALVWRLAPDSILGWRLFLLACELATGALLLRLLGRLGLPRVSVIVYAWAPLAVFEGVHAGHLDVALLPPLLLALMWRQQGHLTRAGAALGVAIALKLYPAALALAWWRRGDWKLPGACVVVLGAGYLPYVGGVGPNVLGFLPEYFGSAEDFNVGLRFFVTDGLGFTGSVSRVAAMVSLAATLLVVLLVIRYRLREGSPGVLAAGRSAVAAWLLLVPTALHPWYAVWILPFLVVRRSAGWLWFTGVVTLSYLAYPWGTFPLWLRGLEFFPLWILLAREVRSPLREWRDAAAPAERSVAWPSSPPASPPG